MVFKAVAMSVASSTFFCACCCYLWSQLNWCGGNGSLKYNLISIMCFRLLVYHISSISNPYLNSRCLCLFLGGFVFFPNKIVFMLSLCNISKQKTWPIFYALLLVSPSFALFRNVNVTFETKKPKKKKFADSITRGETNIIIIS